MKITGGGISGVASLVFFVTQIPIAVTYLVINVFLLFIAVKVLGFNYGIKTVYGVAVVTTFFAVFQNLLTTPLINDPFMSTVLGGILSGIGTGMVFNGGGSTGGTDIIAKIVNVFTGKTKHLMELMNI